MAASNMWHCCSHLIHSVDVLVILVRPLLSQVSFNICFMLYLLISYMFGYFCQLCLNLSVFTHNIFNIFFLIHSQILIFLCLLIDFIDTNKMTPDCYKHLHTKLHCAVTDFQPPKSHLNWAAISWRYHVHYDIYQDHVLCIHPSI